MKDFDSSVSKMHSDLDRETAPYRPSLPEWAVPDDMKETWKPMGESFEVQLQCLVTAHPSAKVRLKSRGGDP